MDERFHENLLQALTKPLMKEHIAELEQLTVKRKFTRTMTREEKNMIWVVEHEERPSGKLVKPLDVF